MHKRVKKKKYRKTKTKQNIFLDVA